MLLRTSIAAVLAVACGLPASAQEGSWGDGHAAVFNTPMGDSSQPEFSGQPIPPKLDLNRRKKKTTVRRFPDACIDGPSIVSAGVGAYAHLGATPDIQRPFCGDVAAAPVQTGLATGSDLTVVTTGAWTTAIVESKRTNTGDQPATLNGGLNLD